MYRIDLMTPDDVAEVSRLERRCFTNPWPASAYRRELHNPAQNYYVVLREGVETFVPERAPERDNGHHGTNGTGQGRGVPRRTLFPIGLARRFDAAVPSGADGSRIVGFAGMWNAFDEAHITTIAVDEAFRGQSLGEWLLATLFDEAGRRGANWLTLEVRLSNDSAQNLYRKWGFSTQGSRRRYYSDNNEDALIMWSRALSDADYADDIVTLRQTLFDRLAGRIVPGTAAAARLEGGATAAR